MHFIKHGNNRNTCYFTANKLNHVRGQGLQNFREQTYRLREGRRTDCNT